MGGCFPDWTVNNCVPHGSVLGQILFVIYINDLDENVQGVSKFVVDTKVSDIVESKDGCQRLQQDLDWLGSWTEEWLMEFNQEPEDIGGR